MRDRLQQPHPLEILLIDDDEQEIAEITRALAQQGRPVHLEVMRTCEEALSYLHADDTEAHRLPRLILIEADHAACHGFEVLNDVKTDQDLWSIPVVLFTSEDHGPLPSYYGGCCSILPKPLSASKLQYVLGRTFSQN